MAKGYIYIMTNPSFKEMVKIGYTTNIETRVQQLNATNIPYDYEVYATYETFGNLEDKMVHKLIDRLNPDLRVRKNREFYVMSPEDAYKLLEAIAIISNTQDKLKRIKNLDEPSTVQKIKRPAINFEQCNIPVGAELIFTENDEVRVIVVNEHKVQYNNELTSLSAVAKSIKGYNVAGPQFFTYNGRLITDIAEETQWKDY